MHVDGKDEWTLYTSDLDDRDAGEDGDNHDDDDDGCVFQSECGYRDDDNDGEITW